MTRPELQTFSSRDAMAGAAARRIAGIVEAALTERGEAVISMCGGTTPGPVYDRLAATDLDWARVTVLLSDERWVDSGSPDSNERLVRERLLRGAAARARFIGLRTEAETPEEAEALLAERLKRATGAPDIGLLGLGADGHTASLFPDAEGGAAALDPEGAAPAKAVSVRGAAAGAAQRLTLTLPVLARHRELLFIARGEDKAPVAQALAGGDSPADWPVTKLIAAAPASRIFWAP